MINNRKLFLVVLFLVPIAVISFIFKDKTNFNLNEESTQEKTEEDSLTVRILIDDKVEELNLEDYIIHVVAGEMPASFEMEALKAQAVASRSYALYKKNNNTNSYDLTSDTTTQVYLSEEEMKEKWGSDYDKYYNRIKEAVASTSGEVATYDDEIIEAYYFSMSSGLTQNVASVFGESRDYLVSVSSVYDNKDLNNYEVRKTFDLKEFKEKLSLTCEEIKIDNIVRNPNGYVNNITICDKTIDGNHLRSLLGLRSANFEINISEVVTITTRGYGHGVGLSQYGANGYAKNGYTYEDIIKHYYQNVEIKNIKNV